MTAAAAAALCHCHRCSGGVSHSAVTAKERSPIQFCELLRYDVGETLIRRKSTWVQTRMDQPSTRLSNMCKPDCCVLQRRAQPGNWRQMYLLSGQERWLRRTWLCFDVADEFTRPVICSEGLLRIRL